MTTSVNKSRIGAFVCMAIVLLIMALILLGDNDFLSDDTEFILFFHNSVSGLSVGSPVVFRGVPLGRVTNISVFSSSINQEITIPVMVKFNESNLLHDGSNTTSPNDDETTEELLRKMIKRGLRARIEMNSLLTGQARIELDFFPNTVAVYVHDGSMLEIPTIDSTKDKLMRTLSEIPLSEITSNVLDVLKGISKIINNPKLGDSLNVFNETLADSSMLLKKLNAISLEMEKLVIKTSNVIGTVDKNLPNMIKKVNVALINFSTSFNQLDKTLKNADNVVSNDSTIIINLNNAINEVARASRGISDLTNMLERTPEVLLRGKGTNR